MARKVIPFAYVPPNRPTRKPIGKHRNRPEYKAIGRYSRKATDNGRKHH